MRRFYRLPPSGQTRPSRRVDRWAHGCRVQGRCSTSARRGTSCCGCVRRGTSVAGVMPSMRRPTACRRRLHVHAGWPPAVQRDHDTPERWSTSPTAGGVAVARLAGDSGRLLVSVPNFAGLAADGSARAWYKAGLAAPSDTLPPATLCAMLTTAGFTSAVPRIRIELDRHSARACTPAFARRARLWARQSLGAYWR